MTAESRRWQYWLLALCAVALVEVAFNVAWTEPHTGIVGFRAERTRTPFVDRIVVAPGGAAAKSTLRTGDLVDTRTLGLGARLRLALSDRGATVGQPIVVTIDRDGTTRRVAILPQHRPQTWAGWLGVAGQLWIVLFGVLLLWRRSGSWEVRLLVAFLVGCYVSSQCLYDLMLPSPYVNFLASTLGEAIWLFGFISFLLYTALFRRPLSPFRRVLTWVSCGVSAIGGALSFADLPAIWLGREDPLVYWRWAGVGVLDIVFGTMFLLATISLFAAVAASRGSERTRVVWATAAIAPVLLFITAVYFDLALAPLGFTAVLYALWFYTPAVLTYSLLNGRLIDLGFIVNRAAVFTGVSVVLLGTFVLVEWLLAEWLQGASHATNIGVSAALALALGLSIRFVHARIDHFVDNVFFRKRHEDEQEIRRFAQEAPYVTDAAILLERSIAVLERHTNATSTEIILNDGAGHYGNADENDPAILRLRATHQVVDLRDLESQLHGDLAFPMVSRGQLVGAIVLGARRSGEAYAPDEAAAVAQMAQSVGASLDALSEPRRRGDVLESLVASVNELREEITRRLPAPALTDS